MPRLSHLHLSVSDLERSIAFYRDKLGLHLGFRGKSMADFDESGLVLDQTEERVDGSAVTVGFAVEDVDATFSTLRDRGVLSDQPPKDQSWGVRNFYCRDPDGYVIEFETRLRQEP